MPATGPPTGAPPSRLLASSVRHVSSRSLPAPQRITSATSGRPTRPSLSPSSGPTLPPTGRRARCALSPWSVGPSVRTVPCASCTYRARRFVDFLSLYLSLVCCAFSDTLAACSGVIGCMCHSDTWLPPPRRLCSSLQNPRGVGGVR